MALGVEQGMTGASLGPLALPSLRSVGRSATHLKELEMGNRNHCISVRVSAEELARLDAERGHRPRGAYLRACWLRLPAQPIVPEVNRLAWQALARSASNLNQLAAAYHQGDMPDLAAIRRELAAFRASLLGGFA